jgi:hypothetical protein
VNPAAIDDLLAELDARPLPTTSGHAQGPAGTNIDQERAVRVRVRAHDTVLRSLLLDAKKRAGGRVRELDTLVPEPPSSWRSWLRHALRWGTVGGILALHVLEIAALLLLWWNR